MAVTSDAGVAPNGQLEADLLVSPSSASAHYILDSTIAFTSGTTYTASVYVKSAGHRYVQLCGNSAAFSSPYKWVNYDLEAGTLNANNCSGTITAVGNGYYRITATMTASSTMTRSFILMFADSLSTGFFPTTTGDAYSGFLAYGFQTEVGSASSSLISTNGSQVSRAADSCAVVDATLFSSGEHTIIWEGDLNATTVDARMANLTDGTTANRVRLDFDDGDSLRLLSEADDVVQANVSYTTDLSVGSHKVAATVKTNEAQLILDGTRRQVDTSGVVPSGLDQLAIMKTFYSSSNVNDGSGHCKRLTYFNVALSQAEAEALTSNP